MLRVLWFISVSSSFFAHLLVVSDDVEFMPKISLADNEREIIMENIIS
jgi:hypothetical protein